MPGKKGLPGAKKQNRKLSSASRKYKKGVKAESAGKTKKAQKKYNKSYKKTSQAATSRGPISIKMRPGPRQAKKK